MARTRDRLGDSLVELIQSKPFDEITVQEVLDRAGVSRSTFYEHYRDKNDLFLSDVDDFFAMLSSLLTKKNDPSARVAPVAEFFAHVMEARVFVAALTESGRMHDVREIGEAHFARGIAERLARPLPGRIADDAMRKSIAWALAGAMFALLSDWLQQGMKATPAEMDRLFHRLIPAEAK